MAFTSIPTRTGSNTNSSADINSLMGNDNYLLGFVGNITGRNVIINGEMRVDQRNAGASQSITTGGGNQYTVDRFFATCTGANVTGQQVLLTGFPSPFQYGYQFSGLASNTGVNFIQRIEKRNCYYLANQTVTISAYIKSSVNKTIGVTVNRPTTTDDTFSALTSVAVTSGSWASTTTPTRFSCTFTAPIEADLKGLQVQFNCPTLLGSETLVISGIQMELGSSATAFEREDYSFTLYKARRYMRALTNFSLGLSFGGTDLYNGVISFEQEMFSAPTLANASYVAQTGNNGTCTLYATAYAPTTNRSCVLGNLTGAVWTANNYIRVTCQLVSEL